MKKNSIVMFLLSVCLLGFYGCSDEDDPEDGKGAIYQVTLQQSGELNGFIKALVVTANGAKLVREETGEVYNGTAVLGDEELVGMKVTLTTMDKAIEFAVSGGAVDRDDEVVTAPMIWTVTVTKNGKEVGKEVVTFEDGKGGEC
ncbi:beta-barrel fold lipoprotein (plasmid) [Bacteroides fragilis]|nr:beta-barrel fold lipoprotein [Bacteroides fragilis]